MSINPYFNKTLKNKASQDMIESLTIEAIKMHGLEVYYIPREMVNEDTLFGEDTISEFTEAHMIEAYLENIDQFGGEGEVLQKFGLQSKDQMDLVISKKRFNQAVIEKSNISLKRPKEGDLIWIPLSNTAFEINFVEHENPFYQLGKLHTYKLTCELFRYSHENIETGNTVIDQIESPVDSDTGIAQPQYAIDITVTCSSSCGEYTLGETVYQMPLAFSSFDINNAVATANVIDWTKTSDTAGTLRVNNITGTFSASANDAVVKGNSSGASWSYSSEVTTTVKVDPQPEDNRIDNDNLQDFANEFVDFSEYNPFSEGDF